MSRLQDLEAKLRRSEFAALVFMDWLSKMWYHINGISGESANSNVMPLMSICTQLGTHQPLARDFVC